MNITLQSAKMVGTRLATIGLTGARAGAVFFFSLAILCSKKPSLKHQLFRYTIFSFALTEAVGSFALMMIFLIRFSSIS